MDKIPLDWPSLTVINVRAQIAEQDQTARMCSVRVKWICPKLGKPQCFQLDLQLLSRDKEIYLSLNGEKRALTAGSGYKDQNGHTRRTRRRQIA